MLFFNLHCFGVSVDVLEIWTACFSSILMDLSFGAQSTNIIHKKLSSAQSIYRNHDPVIKDNRQKFLWAGFLHFLLCHHRIGDVNLPMNERLAKLSFPFMLWYAVIQKKENSSYGTWNTRCVDFPSKRDIWTDTVLSFIDIFYWCYEEIKKSRQVQYSSIIIKKSRQISSLHVPNRATPTTKI